MSYASSGLYIYKGYLLDNVFKFYVLACFYTPFLSSIIPIPGVNILDDAVFFLMLGVCLLQFKHRIVEFDLILLCIPALIVFSILIAYFEGVSITVIILSLKNIKNLFLFIVLACLLQNHMDFVKRHILILLVASVPLALFQFFTVSHQDDITGLFGPKSSSLYSFLLIAYVTTFIVEKGFYSVGWRWLLFIPVFLNETKITFVLFPLMLVALLIFTMRIKVYHVILVLLLSVIVSSALDEVYYSLYGYPFSDVFDSAYLDSYLFDYTEMHKDVPRFFRLHVAYEILSSSDFFNWMFGYGLGAEYVGDGGDRLGVIAYELRNTLLNQGTRIQLFQFLLDFGVVGTVFLVTVLLIMLFRIMLKECNYENLFSLSILMLMVFSLVYQNMFFTKQLSFVLFFFVYSSLMKVRHKRNLRSLN
ncbi:hypothetical protein ACMXYV_03495 [Neptuniibacter sp. SY11_33]|uniref:hypothetical protein n=1 Tax=Neptuniibacter sp. SY11_33 TaxID=3398215 RepID=UPI0039F5F0B8